MRAAYALRASNDTAIGSFVLPAASLDPPFEQGSPMTTGLPSNIQTVAELLGGEVSGGQVLAPGPGHGVTDRPMRGRLDASPPDGFVVNSFAGDDAIACKDYVRGKLGLPPFEA